MVKNAVNEMRRYYSRKVVDVLIKVTRRTLDLIIKPFTAEALVNADGTIFYSHTRFFYLLIYFFYQ